ECVALIRAIATHLAPGRAGQLIHETLEATQQDTDVWTQAWGLAQLAPLLPGHQRETILRERLLDVTRALTSYQRGWLVSTLATYLPADLRRQALELPPDEAEASDGDPRATLAIIVERERRHPGRGVAILAKLTPRGGSSFVEAALREVFTFE